MVEISMHILGPNFLHRIAPITGPKAEPNCINEIIQDASSFVIAIGEEGELRIVIDGEDQPKQTATMNPPRHAENIEQIIRIMFVFICIVLNDFCIFFKE